MNENISDLLSIATYFRQAMMDETKLPENAVTMPTLIKVNNFQMIKVSDKAKHYHDVVNNIEKALEAYAMKLTATIPSSQKEIEFKKVNVKPIKTETKKQKETKTNTVSTDIKQYLEDGKADESKPKYNSLLSIPKEKLSAEDREFIAVGWSTLKGVENKAKIYNKVRKLLNNNSISIAELRNDIQRFISKYKEEAKKENFKSFEEEIKAEKIDFDTTTNLKLIRNGEELTSGKLKWVDKEGDFNLVLLTDGKTEDDVDPQNMVKLMAMYYRTIGKEHMAIDIISKFYSDSKKGIDWPREKARFFLNNLFRINQFKELKQVVKNMLIYRNEQGDYEKAIPFAKSLLFNYSKHEVNEKPVSWPAHKVNNFIDKCLMELADEGVIKLKEEKKTVKTENPKKVEKPKIVVSYSVNAKGKVSGKIQVGDKIVTVSNYTNLKGFTAACKLIALNQVRLLNKKADDNSYELIMKEEAGGTANTKKVTPKNPVALPAKSQTANTTKNQQKKKVVTVVKETPNKAIKNPQVGKSTQNQKEALKTAKNGQLEHPTKSNVNEKKEMTDRPSYSAIISLEKDKTYSCEINGFNGVIKTTGAKTVEEAKANFIEALKKYNEKVALENERARISHKKGKVLHMKPDFTKGELTFLLKTVKTGTNN